MVHLRLGHFVGPGNSIGLVPALLPRLKTRLVPWIERGHARLPLVAGEDIGQAFALAATSTAIETYDAFNIAGPEFPTSREVFQLIAEESGLSLPWFSVSRKAAYTFGWLMEKLHAVLPLLPGGAPFLTRSIVYLAEDWPVSTKYAEKKLGFRPTTDWRSATRSAVRELRARDYPWPRLAQATDS
jgi:nucleoside-diphosphate-sugar epimerase